MFLRLVEGLKPIEADGPISIFSFIGLIPCVLSLHCPSTKRWVSVLVTCVVQLIADDERCVDNRSNLSFCQVRKLCRDCVDDLLLLLTLLLPLCIEL